MSHMKTLMTLVVTLLAMCASVASANEIYKWTDADGNVIYGDRPQEDSVGSVERVAIASRRTDAASVSAAVDARRERDTARNDARSARESAERDAAEARAEAEQLAQRCGEYRARLEKMLVSRRLYRLNEEGQREFLDDAGIQEARSALQERIQEMCSG